MFKNNSYFIELILQVNSWLTWLQDASSEEEEDEGDN